MKLLVSELRTAVNQVVTPQRNTIVEAIRPHLYRHNWATGALKIQILTSEEDVVAESAAVDIADIGSMDYFHGYVRFDISAYLQKDQQYTLRLVSEGGYAFDESAYVGWCNAIDLGKYPINGTPASSWRYPLDVEVWERTAK